MSAPTSTRQEIADTLRQLRDAADAQRREQLARGDLQRQRTRSLVRLQQLDTRDGVKLERHAEHASHYNQRTALLEQLQTLQHRYQALKKRLPEIKDRVERHERLQRAKAVRDEHAAALKQQLAMLEAAAPAAVRPGSATHPSVCDRAATPAGVASVSLPDVVERNGNKLQRSEAVTAVVYKKLMEQVRAIKLERQTLLDPYEANLKLARLWDRLHDTARCLENYNAACRVMKEKHLALIPPDIMDAMLESQRLRRREALHFLFSRALLRKQRKEAADLLVRFLELSRPEDRLNDVAYAERILREQEYIEDPTLATVDEITFAIRSTNSLGHLTDLRFRLLQELLTASPTDPYLIESVANIHVRRGEFAKAEALTAQFVELPLVRRISLYSTFSELRCGM